MRPLTTLTLVFALCSSLGLCSCSTTRKENPDQVGVFYPEDTTEVHTIQALAKVPIDRTTGSVGGQVGSLAGSLGGGIVGSIVGGLLGPVLEKGVTRKKADEFTLIDPRGDIVTLIQMPEGNAYRAGQRVSVHRSSRTGAATILPLR